MGRGDNADHLQKKITKLMQIVMTTSLLFASILFGAELS
jgi:hypothetical protein